MYPDRKSGKEPVAPALLAMATILQAWLGVSDEDAVEFAEMDKRWQMLLGVLGSEEAPFSQGALFNFRRRLIATLRAAFDGSPLFGAGGVEDTFNLIGHAAREVLGAQHREAFRRLWSWRSKPKSPRSPRLGKKVIALIHRMSLDNRTWGAERIRGEVLKLGFCVATITIQIYISRFRSTPTGQRWSTFLKNQAAGIWSCDLYHVQWR